MSDTKMNALTAASAWTSTCSVIGNDSASPTGSFLWTKAKFDAIYGTGPANPTQAAGLTAVNGTATTFMRSDGAPAISQSIAPTWTGLHTFNHGLTANVAGFGPTIGRADGGQANLTFDSNGRAVMQAIGTGHMMWITDNLQVQMKSDVVLGWSASGVGNANDITLARDGTHILGLYDSAAGSAHGGYLHFGRAASDTDPAAPTDGATIYSKQSGGKNALFVRFPTGTPIQIAIEA